MNNESLKYSEQHSKAIPADPGPKIILEKYENTEYYDSYNKGLWAGKMTLDEKNKHKIVSNLIFTIIDDAKLLNAKNKNLNGVNLLNNLQQIFNTCFDMMNSEQILFDIKRAASIIEGYGKHIENKNS